MTWSLNEIESLARKAARGSGLSWGLAEEAGKSVRWLVEFDLPGPRLLADLLTQNDQTSYSKLCPIDVQSIWAASGGALCPLITGALVCDHAGHLSEAKEIRLGKTSYPLLLLPYASAAAEIANTPLEVFWGATLAQCDPHGRLSIEHDASLQCPYAMEVTIRCSSSFSGEPIPRTKRGDISADASKTLNMMAQRTYAPDTAESRLSGAGAGLTDND